VKKLYRRFSKIKFVVPKGLATTIRKEVGEKAAIYELNWVGFE
jgi:hypothetical protein